MFQTLHSHFIKKVQILVVLLFAAIASSAQKKDTVLSPDTNFIQAIKDTTPATKKAPSSARMSKYDSAMKAHRPGKAALRSAIIPGWGQIYNKKYWKLPIVYGGLGTCGAIFFYNLGNYRDTRFAYRVKYNMRVNGTDSTLFPQIKDKLKPLSEESLRFYRNQFRRDIDFSALVFILLWGLNVVDATVDAHLKSFDVSPDLSLRIKPGYSDFAKTSGLSIVLKIGK